MIHAIKVSFSIVMCKVPHGYTVGRVFPHRTRTRRNRYPWRVIPVTTRHRHGTVRNLRYLWYPRYRGYARVYYNRVRIFFIFFSHCFFGEFIVSHCDATKYGSVSRAYIFTPYHHSHSHSHSTSKTM